jgi:predicted ATPase
MGRRVGLGRLARLSARPLGVLAASLDTLVRSRLLEEEEEEGEQGVTYGIAHPLVQEAVYANVGSARRVALHRQLARNLVASGLVAEAVPHFVWSASAIPRPSGH